MSSATTLFDLTGRSPARPVPAATAAVAPTSRAGARTLSVMFLAALVAALVVLADRFVSTWADEHLFLGWVVLWAVIFAGLALFAGTARTLAARAIRALDGWARARASARAEARLWDIARSDPRVMTELMAIRAFQESKAQADSAFAAALAPLGIEHELPRPVANGWAAHIERMGQNRVRNMHLHYI